jgi:hypothetical protein
MKIERQVNAYLRAGEDWTGKCGNFLTPPFIRVACF